LREAEVRVAAGANGDSRCAASVVQPLVGSHAPPYGYASASACLYLPDFDESSDCACAKILGALRVRVLGQRTIGSHNRPIVVLDSVEYKFLAKATLNGLVQMATSANIGGRRGNHCVWRPWILSGSVLSNQHAEYSFVSAGVAMVSFDMGGFVLLDLWINFHFWLRPCSLLSPQESANS
jgi:hypothetical protein